MPAIANVVLDSVTTRVLTLERIARGTFAWGSRHETAHTRSSHAAAQRSSTTFWIRVQSRVVAAACGVGMRTARLRTPSSLCGYSKATTAEEVSPPSKRRRLRRVLVLRSVALA
jgi:hypothetical protein